MSRIWCLVLVLVPSGVSCLRTNGVNTNGAAAKVMDFDRLGKKVRPGHFWEDKSRLTRVPKKSFWKTSFKKAVTPLVLTPCVPFRVFSEGRRPLPRAGHAKLASRAPTRLGGRYCQLQLQGGGQRSRRMSIRINYVDVPVGAGIRGNMKRGQ